MEIKVSLQTVTRAHPTNPRDMLKKMPKKIKKSTRPEQTPTRQGQPVRAQPADGQRLKRVFGPPSNGCS